MNEDHKPEAAASGAPAERAMSREDLDRIFPELYWTLYAIAQRIAPGAGSISAGTLVNEAYLRLRHSPNLPVDDETHFKRIAARAMRFVLYDHLNARRER